MPALANKTYFNYGGQGPLPSPSLEAIVASWRAIQSLGPFTTAVWPEVESTVARLRQRLAGWLGVPATRLSFTENVTSGCVLPLWGLPWQAGETLLLSDCEHPGVVAACRELARRHQLELQWLPVADLRCTVEEAEALLLERLEGLLRPGIRLVALSHLLWNTGQLMPIAQVAERLAREERPPWLLVDGAQSLGSIPVAEAAASADIYACTGHKWCCGPEGLGVVALSERLLHEARPTLIGWRSLRQESDGSSDYHPDGRRFEVATSCIPLFAGLDRSLQLLEEVGSPAERLEAIRHQSSRLWHGLQRIPGLASLLSVPPPAGLISFRVSEGWAVERPAALVERLGGEAIWLRSLDDPACLRACTHVVSTDAEIDRLLGALAALSASPGPQGT
jgi:L-cysteine/cystine lyase